MTLCDCIGKRLDEIGVQTKTVSMDLLDLLDGNAENIVSTGFEADLGQNRLVYERINSV